jgi:hypothetical protein
MRSWKEPYICIIHSTCCRRPKVLHCATRRRCSSHFRVNYFVNLSRFYGTTRKIWIGPDIAGLCQEKYHSGRCNVGLAAKQTLEHPLKIDLGRRNCVSSCKVVCIYVKLQDGPLCVSYAQISYQTIPKIVLTQWRHRHNMIHKHHWKMDLSTLLYCHVC